MTGNSTTQATQDALAELRLRKEQVIKDIQVSKARMSDAIHEIVAPAPKAQGKLQGVNQLVSNALAVYEGVRIGVSIVSAIRGLFGKRTRRYFV